MEIDLTTPALLFSAISLIMLAYTNRLFAETSLSDPCYASNRYWQFVIMCGEYVFNVHTVVYGVGLYFWFGTYITHYIVGHFCP